MSGTFTAQERQRPYPTVRFHPTEEWYYGPDEVAIPLGASRIAGPIVDLPPGGLPVRDDLVLAAQLDLSAFVAFDREGVLPRSGHLYVFADISQDEGQVFHADVPTSALVRTVRAHDPGENLARGCLVVGIHAEVESLAERFVIDPDSAAEQYDSFAGSEKSKLFGLFTFCQRLEEEMRELLTGDRIQLLQIGEDFTGHGVINVSIDPEELRQRRFDGCEVLWSFS